MLALHLQAGEVIVLEGADGRIEIRGDKFRRTDFALTIPDGVKVHRERKGVRVLEQTK